MSSTIATSSTANAALVPDARSVAASSPQPSAGTYAIVPGRSTISFSTKHIFGMGTLAGTLDLARGEIVVGDHAGGSRAEATIEVGSFRSGNAMRDKAALSPRFFGAGNHPEARFRTERIRETAPGSWVADGVLTIKGADSPLQIRVDRLTATGEELSLHGTAVIDRYAAGLDKSKGMPARMVDLDLAIVATVEPAGHTA